MNPNREDVLFQMALEKPAEKRAAFLDAMCEGDSALRQRLEALLAAHEQSQGVLAETAAASVKATMKIQFTDAPDETVGQKIGHYKILEKIGEGGCGAVYMAEQTEPVRRRVALKVIKLGMDTKSVIARFEAERQALAMMDHPNIAKVLDAGTTETGRPFFVMELVRGIKITDYCDQNKLPPRARLDLFIQVCHAIQHAHQKGIIHRDIKPSNILVTLHDGVPVPKVIDFGIAKATTDLRLTDKTLFTAYEQFIGTPAYMSPEQAEMSGLDIDTRSDIYSLGVLLYELLTGKTPFDAKELMQSGLDAMRKTIREKEPLRPSTKLNTLQGEDLTTTASHFGSDAPQLIHLLRGDLDWIVMKCLEKDRTRRYETANGLAADLKRHLSHEPVTARPPSAAYKFQKAFRRNKLAFTAGFAVAAVLLLGIIATTLQSVRATHAKKEALAAQAQEAVQRNKAEASEREAVADKQKAVAAQASESLQRQRAEANEQKALAAQAAETKLREQAEADELVARQRAYALDMNAAMQAFHENNIGRAQDLLNRQHPQSGQKDLRGWEWRYLWGQVHSDALFTFYPTSAEIHSLAASADGHFLAVGNYLHKGGITVWDLRTRQEIAYLAKKDHFLLCAFSPTEPLLAFTGYNLNINTKPPVKNTLYLWNAATRQMVAEIPLNTLCGGLVFSRDGRTLLTLLDGVRFTFWRIPDGTQSTNYPVKAEFALQALSFSATPDLSLAAYTKVDDSGAVKRIAVMDLRNGKELWSAVAASSNQVVTAVALSPDGKILASASGLDKPDMRLWDAATGKEIGRLEGHHSGVNALVFWPDGKKLASAGNDRTIRIWDVASRKCLDVLRGHRDEVRRLALLPDNKTLVSGGKDGMVCLWDTSVTHPRRENITWPEKFNQWRFGADSQSVLTYDQAGEVARWTGTDFQKKESLLKFGTEGANAFALSGDGRFFLLSTTNGTSIWDVSQKILLHQLTNVTLKVSENGQIMYSGPVAFLHERNKLITRGPMTRLHELDPATGSEIQSWPVPITMDGEGITGFSPDERLCVTIDTEGNVVTRNLVDKTDGTLPLDITTPSDFAFSGDGRLFAESSRNFKYVRVWDAKTWREVTTLRDFLQDVKGVNFSPDGKRLATGGGAGSEAVKLWDTASWQEVGTLQGSGAVAGGPFFSPDGNDIGVLNEGGTLQIWRAPAWEEINAVETEQNSQREQTEAAERAARNRQIAGAEADLAQDHFDDAEQILEGMPLQPEMAGLFVRLGEHHARYGQWRQALGNYSKAARLEPSDLPSMCALATLDFEVGDRDGYNRWRGEILGKFGATTNVELAMRLATVAMIAAPSVDETGIISNLMDSVTASATSPTNSNANFTLSLWDYRQGRFADAQERLQKIVASPGVAGDWNRQVQALTLLAMSECQLKQTNDARATFVKGLQLADEKMVPPGDKRRDDWNEWLMAHFLMREAAALMPDVTASNNVFAAIVAEKPDWQIALTRAGLKFKTGDTSELILKHQPISDLSILRGAPISTLWVTECAVSDLTPLRGMPLKQLYIYRTKVSDLKPLTGMALVHLDISGTPVSDLSPLRGMPLTYLAISDCPNITDLSPLAGMTTLQFLQLSLNATNIEILRGLKNLTRIGSRYDSTVNGPDKTAAQFWSDYDKKRAHKINAAETNEKAKDK